MEVAPILASLSVSPVEWLPWSELPWMERAVPGGAELRFCFRLIESAAQAESPAVFLKHELPEVASEFAAQWAGVFRRGSEWERLAEFGRRPIDSLPQMLMTLAIERDSAGCAAVAANGNGGEWNLCCAPLHKGGQTSEVLLLCGRGLGAKSLPGILAAAWALGCSLETVGRRDLLAQMVDRLRTTLRIGSKLGSTRDTKPLLA